MSARDPVLTRALCCDQFKSSGFAEVIRECRITGAPDIPGREAVSTSR